MCGCASASAILATRRWLPGMCCKISPRRSLCGSSRCLALLPRRRPTLLKTPTTDSSRAWPMQCRAKQRLWPTLRRKSLRRSPRRGARKSLKRKTSSPWRRGRLPASCAAGSAREAHCIGHDFPLSPHESRTETMGFKCGIVGLPNVGKSTLCNALTQSAAAQAANYPFCTIDPNVGEVPVPDPRFDRLATIAKSAQVVPTRLTFVDIAGLVRGASKGEGLGNQFLAHIREVDAIACVLRCFEDDDVVHVEGRIDPIADAETIETELILADLDSLERRVPILEKKIRGQDKEAKKTLALLERALVLLREGKPARLAAIEEEERAECRSLGPLTAVPVLYVCNVDEASAATGNVHSARIEALAKSEGAGCAIISAKIEAELAELPRDERQTYLAELGLQEPGLNRLINEGYKLLGLITYFTAGPKEARAREGPEGDAAAPACARG